MALCFFISQEIETYPARDPFQLSGGEFLRPANARALCIHPKLLICDKAASALDVLIQQQILDLIKELQKTGSSPFSLSAMTQDR